MPNHVHLLIWPIKPEYSIAEILHGIKGRSAKLFRTHITEKAPESIPGFSIEPGQEKSFRIWQAGGGFDKNLVNSRQVHHAIRYIEGNPVRAGFVDSADLWRWSSAHARKTELGVMPDEDDIPMLMGE